MTRLFRVAVCSPPTMPNPAILAAITEGWSKEPAKGKSALDLSCASGETSQLLAGLGYRVIATEYGMPPLIDGIDRVGGVDLNSLLPFKKDSFDAVDIIEVIEHLENQPQLIREIARVLRPGGIVVISTPNVLNVFSRVRFLFTGFLRGRVRPAHYTSKPG